MRATTSEKNTAIAAVQPNCTKKRPTMPVMNAVGRNTAISVNVVAMTARPISSAASIAASYGRLPSRRWRMMFSISTMASSTRMPTTSDSEISVTPLSVKPRRYIAAKVGMAASGSAAAATSVARQSRRNSHTTTHGQRPALPQQHHRALEALLGGGDEVEGLGGGDVGMRRLQLNQCGTHAGGHFQLASATGSADFEGHHGLAVEEGRLAAFGRGVEHACHLVEPDAAAVGQRDFHRRQLLCRAYRRQRAHRLLHATDVGPPA
jgi:hypothetical protein